MAQVLTTLQSQYIFDADNQALTLKHSGKFSSVYIGIDVKNKQQVIVKVLTPDYVNHTQSLQVHLKEASYALLHPRLQKTIDYFVDADTHYLIKEYIPGQTLRQLMAQKQQPAYYYKVIVDVLDVLNALHQHQIFHCDIKPENILIGDQVYVLDLGLAFNSDVDTQCLSNFALGYAAPELMLQQPEFINAGTDVFALAMCLYHCLTGSNPFFHQHPVYAMQLQLNLPLPPHKKVNKNLLDVLQKATYRQSFGRPPHQLTAAAINEVLAINKQKRYKSAVEFSEALLPCF